MLTGCSTRQWARGGWGRGGVSAGTAPRVGRGGGRGLRRASPPREGRRPAPPAPSPAARARSAWGTGHRVGDGGPFPPLGLRGRQRDPAPRCHSAQRPSLPSPLLAPAAAGPLPLLLWPLLGGRGAREGRRCRGWVGGRPPGKGEAGGKRSRV